MSKLLDAKGIEARIAVISKAGKKLDADIQLVGLSCLAHIEAHGDVRLFNRLYLAMPKGSRKTALTGWALAFGKLKANDGDNKKDVPFLYDKERVTNMVDAAQKPWYDFAPEKSPDEMFDVVGALNNLLRKAGKATKNNNPELVEKLRQVFEEAQPEPEF